MTRSAFLKTYFPRLAASFALLCLIFYTLFHVFTSSADALLTLPVRQVTDLRVISGQAYLFRNEEVLTVEAGGLVDDLAKSGTKVSVGTQVCRVFAGQEGLLMADAQVELDRINRLISVLEDSAISADTTLAKAEQYRTNADDAYFAIRNALESKEPYALHVLEDQLLTNLNRYDALIGKGLSVGEALAELQTLKQSLLQGECRTLSTGTSGYYYNRSYVDGYETVFTPEALKALTAQSFAELIAAEPNTPDGVAVGKMVYGYEWSLVISFDPQSRSFLQEGGSYPFVFPENGDRELTFTCTRLIESEDGGAVAVFTANEIPTDFLYLRNQRVQITVDQCKGYYVPETALVTQNGVEGVYIFRDSTVYFRRIEVLYRGDGYCVAAEQGDRGDEYLALYDILITSGKNLYEGRVYE